ncbi:SOCS domain-containing protein stops [Andrena cerasifolii]|uniref:SOCS domain-containing protein stops n=1 Tax=Andrena cerasifolii TaxID=2819439 RepID=UPI0040376E5D
MEVLIDCYFDRLFAEMERSCLASRYKRRELVSYFSDVINSCAAAENLDKQDVCERIVMSALRYHNIAMMENGYVCMLGKFHNVLYVAAKLCYDWNLGNNEIVSRLLNDIFYCEKTFERILVGAIFGTRVTHFLSGWKSDFEDRKENMRALVYFLHHATVGRLEYRVESAAEKRRFIDVPMESYGQALPLRVAIQNGSPDILLIMLRYGASVEPDMLAPSPLEMLLTKLNEYDPRPGQDQAAYPEPLLLCLRFVLRTVTTAFVKTPRHIADQSGVFSVSLYEQYPALMEQKLVPPERSGMSPPELRHLCRCKIRETLFENWALPHGIQSLQIPQSLMDYLDLSRD